MKEEFERSKLDHVVAKRVKTRGRKPTVRCGLMSGPLRKEERTEARTQTEEDIDTLEWEMEEELEVGARLDKEAPRDPENRWQYPRLPRGQEKRRLM